MLPAQDSELPLISLIAPRRQGVYPRLSFPCAQPCDPRPRYAITVDNRLARVEDSIQRLMPVAQAFDNWLQTNDQKLPWVDQLASHFRRLTITYNCVVQFSTLPRDK